MGVTDHLARLLRGDGEKSLIVAPFLTEIVLRDGRSFFVHSVAHHADDEHIAIFRVWDLRMFDAKGITELQSALNKVFEQDDLQDPAKIDPKLDWAWLHVPKDEVPYVVEWMDRLWPEELRKRLGFHPRRE